MIEKEVWKDIPGFENYQASNLGRVKRLACLDKRGGRLKEKILVVSVQRYSAQGYWRSFVSIGLGFGRKCYCLSVGRAVLLAFRGLPKKGQVCRHLDDNIRNNKLSNLKWGTQKQNIHDAIRNGIHYRFIGGPKKRPELTKDQVLEIRRRCKSWSKTDGKVVLAKEFGVKLVTIEYVLKRDLWLDTT